MISKKTKRPRVDPTTVMTSTSSILDDWGIEIIDDKEFEAVKELDEAKPDFDFMAELEGLDE